MNIPVQAIAPAKVIYPESDGQPMADNTAQFRWIATLQTNLDVLFRSDPNVFVAGDLLWYPIEGDNRIRIAPDTMVVFGRPKGDRGSYQQWVEENISPQVVFEVLSPGNRVGEMVRKFGFYERHGVEEYYIYDPDSNTLDGWMRRGEFLEAIPEMNGWKSPRLGIRFEPGADELRIYTPDGRPFQTYQQLFDESVLQRQRAERLAAQLRALGIKPED